MNATPQVSLEVLISGAAGAAPPSNQHFQHYEFESNAGPQQWY